MRIAYRVSVCYSEGVKQELLGWSFIVTASVLLLAWPTSVNQDRLEEEGDASEGELYQTMHSTANLALSGVRFFESRGDKPRVNLRSQSAELYQKENYTFLTKVDADFFAERTGNSINTQSNFGRSFMETERVELEGDVRIRSQKGYFFELKKLTYDGRKQKFLSDDFVQMKGPDEKSPTMTLKGYGLDSDLEREQFLIRSRVHASRKLKNSQWLKISSQSGEFFTDDQKAVFYGDVSSSMPGVSIQSQKMVLQIQKEKESLLAQGKVRLSNRDRVGHAESAFIEVNGNAIVLEGKAEIEDIQKNKVQGSRIILYGDDDRIEVENAKGKLAP